MRVSTFQPSDITDKILPGLITTHPMSSSTLSYTIRSHHPTYHRAFLSQAVRHAVPINRCHRKPPYSIRKSRSQPGLYITVMAGDDVETRVSSFASIFLFLFFFTCWKFSRARFHLISVCQYYFSSINCFINCRAFSCVCPYILPSSFIRSAFRESPRRQR